MKLLVLPYYYTYAIITLIDGSSYECQISSEFEQSKPACFPRLLIYYLQI